MKHQVNKIRIIFLVFFFLILIGGIFCYFKIQEKKTGVVPKVVFTTGFAKDDIFKIEDEICKQNEILVYLTTLQNMYREVYGQEIFDVSIEGVTLKENVKDMALAKIAQIKTMLVLAKEKNVVLSDEENELARKCADEYFDSLNVAEKAYLGVDSDSLYKMYSEYALANKVYDVIIRDVNPEISDDEARTIKVAHILLKTYSVSNDGKRIEMSKEAKDNLYEKALEIRELALDPKNDFSVLASKYSDDQTIIYSFGKGVMDETFEETSFNLDTDEISEVVESSSGFHIIKCLSTFDRAETDANKIELLEERRAEAFGNVYDEFVQKLVRNINEKLWDSIELTDDLNIMTSDFFDVYERVFGVN